MGHHWPARYALAQPLMLVAHSKSKGGEFHWGGVVAPTEILASRRPGGAGRQPRARRRCMELVWGESERALTTEAVPWQHFKGRVARRWGANGVVGAGAAKDVEMRRGGMELEEATIGWSGGRRRLVLVVSSWRMERATPACFELFFAATLWGSRMGTLGDDGDARHGCSWWREVRWHGRSMMVEECNMKW
jgi:hypothetical protein